MPSAKHETNPGRPEMTSEDIIALKDRLRAYPDDDNRNMKWASFGALVCANIAHHFTSANDPGVESFDAGRQLDSNEYTAILAIHWYSGLNRALDLPGDEWPETMTGLASPTGFANVLSKLETERTQSHELPLTGEQHG